MRFIREDNAELSEKKQATIHSYQAAQSGWLETMVIVPPQK